MIRLFYILLFLPFISIGQLLTTHPGADGFGKYATGGRDGTIIHVTNLNDSGTGSLRDALDQTYDRVIVFDIAGDIFPTTRYALSEAEGNVTIAGETAPSPGITIRGRDLNSSQFGGVLDIAASNVIIRYITIRDDNAEGVSTDAIRIRNDVSGLIEDVMIDHVTLSHGDDENLSIRDATNITVSNCLFSDVKGSGTMLYGSNNFNGSIVNNYYVLNGFRNAFIGFGTNNETSEYINNIVYGYQEGHVVVVGNVHDALGNIYKGLLSDYPNYPSMTWSLNATNNPSGTYTDGSFYFSDNILLNPGTYGLYNTNATTYNQSSRQITNSFIDTWLTAQGEIEEKVLPNAGNSIHQESYDLAKINHYYNDTGSFSFGTISAKSSNSKSGFDTDGDDMDDVAEIAIWGDITTTNSPWASTNGTNITTYDAWPNHDKTRFYYASDAGEAPVGGGSGVSSVSGKITGDAILIAN